MLICHSRDQIQKFPDLFDAIGKAKEELGIEQVALSQTTLEEVFMELGQEKKKRKKRKRN